MIALLSWLPSCRQAEPHVNANTKDGLNVHCDWLQFNVNVRTDPGPMQAAKLLLCHL